MTMSLNGIRASSVRLLTPWTGAWVADVDLDLGERLDLASGPAVLTIGTTQLAGTIDPAQSGRFGPRARARVVAGAGGWEKTVAAKHYHNDGGVLSAAVLATTAAEVGERIVETAPGRFGIDFVRPAGPAAKVLSGLAWFVDATGTTIVGPRVPAPAPTLRVLEWDARTRVATIGGGDELELVTPGMLLSDPRFGTAKIRDVEQTWGDTGARATAWTVATDKTPGTEGGGELVAVISAVAREAVNAAYPSAVRYRVLGQLPDGRFTLQVVKKGKGVPDLKSISLAPAIPGMSVKVPPGTIVHVAFIEGDRSLPVVVRFEKGPKPLEVQIDGIHVHVGTGLSPRVGPVALAPAAISAFGAIVTALNAYPVTAPAGAALATALSPLMTLLPSTKLFSE